MPLLAVIFASLMGLALPDRPVHINIPPESVAWWSFDPSGFNLGAEPPGSERAILNAGLRSLVSSGVIGDDQTTRIVQSVLAASVVGSVPHTLCILDIAQAPATPNTKPGLEFGAVLALHTTLDHAPFVRTIEAILVDQPGPIDKPRPHAAQRQIKLPGDRNGVFYREAGWPEWREVSWCSSEGSFVVGIGKDSLTRWFTAQDSPPRIQPDIDSPEWVAHQNAVTQSRPAGQVFLEAFVNLNALRRALPDAFPGGRLDQMIRSSSLTNGRAFMLHARWIKPADVTIGRIAGQYGGPPMIALDATWSARSEAPGSVRHMALTESSWPADLTIPPPPGGYIAVLPMQADHWLARALGVYGATLEPPAAAKFSLRRRAWHSNHAPALERVTAALGPWLVISNHPKPPVPMLGAATVYAELRPRADPKGFAADLTALLEPFSDHVAFDPGPEVWSLRADPKGWFQVLSWGLASVRGRSVLIGGIDLGIPGTVSWRTVEKNREWLAGLR